MKIRSNINFVSEDLFKAKLESSETILYLDKKRADLKAKGPNSLEMFLSAVGGCVGESAKRYFKRYNITFKELLIEASADLAKDKPLRLVNIRAVVKTDADLGDKKEVFKEFIASSPVHNTLLHTKDMTIILE